MRDDSPKIVFGLVFLFVLFSLAALLIHLEKPTGSLKGVVQTENGAPIAGARIEIDAYPRSRRAFSDAQGKFRFDAAEAAEYFVNVSARGFQTEYMRNRQAIEEGKIRDLGVVVLKEKEPDLQINLWSATKTPQERIIFSMTGAKVKRVQFNAYRIDAIAYLKGGGTLEDLEKNELDPAKEKSAEAVKEWVEVIPDEEVAEFDHKARADLSDPSLYLIHASAESADRSKVFTQNILVNKTDLGFAVKRDDTKVVVFASSFLDPKPVADASVFLFDSTGKFTEAKTSAQGVAEFDLAASGLDLSESLRVVALSGKNLGYTFAQKAGSLWEEGEGEGEGEGEEEAGPVTSRPNVFLYTERPLYRPGQKVYFKGILRKETLDGLYQLPAPRDVSVRIENPKGDPLQEMTLKTNEFGSFWGELDLDDEADLGYYNIITEVDGKEFREGFEVDEYRKPEFKVEATADPARIIAGDKLKFLIDTQYYFGAPVEAEIDYTLYKNDYSHSEYDEGYGGGYGELAGEGKAKTDAQGHLNLSFDTGSSEFDQSYTLRVTAKDMTEKMVTRETDVLATAGDFYFSTRRTEFLGTPKKPFSLTVITKDWDDKPVARDFKIQIERERWDGIAGEYRYKKAGSVEGKTQANGEGPASLTVDQGGYYRLVLSARDSKGRTVKHYDYLWVSGSVGDSDDYGVEEGLKVVADKAKYEAGETAKVLVVGPMKNATALVSLEGPKIHAYYPVILEGFSKTLEIPLKKEFIPNVFVSVVMIGKKVLYQGSAELAVSPKENFLNVAITPDAAKYHPADAINYKVTTTDAQGKPVPAELSVGVVDESLYALRADTTDIKNHFWGPKPNRVTLNDSFGGYYTGGIEKEDQALLRRNFKDTAYWAPSLKTDAQGQGTVSFKLPDNLTTWRATVLAQTPATAVGQELNKVISSKDLIVRLAVPRFFTERDQTTLKAIVHNYTDQDQVLKVSLGLKGIDFADPKDGEDRTLTVGSKKAVSFDFKVLPKRAGSTLIQLLAKNAAVSDGVELKIPVLPHGLEEHAYAQGDATAGAPGEEKLTQVGISVVPSADPTRTKLKVTLDTTFVAQLLGSLSYLIDYPYGCVEQTLSRTLPALMVSHLYQSLGLADAVLDKKIPKVIERGLKRLVKFQHADGGWGWWKEDETDPFMTAYALYGLLRAKQMGEKVDDKTLEDGKNALKELLKKPLPERFKGRFGEDTQYFLYYVASLAGLPNRPPLPGDRPLPSHRSHAFLILALKAQGKTAELPSLVASLEKAALCRDSLCRYSDDLNPNLGYSEDAEVTAWVLQALMAGDSTNQVLKDEMVKWLLKSRQGGIWRHTRETAAVLYALSEYAKALPGSGSGVKARLDVNGQPVESVNVASPHFVRNLPSCVSQAESRPAKCAELKAGNNNLGIANQTESTLYYQTDLSFFSQAEDLSAFAAGIRLKREYVHLNSEDTTVNGERIYKVETVKEKVKKGEVIGVRVTVESDDDLQYVVVEDPLPSGFEVVPDIRFDPKADYFSETTVRDEKIALFSTYLRKGIHVFNYAVRPELPGAFHAMPTQSYEMYRPEVRGTGAETRLTVE